MWSYLTVDVTDIDASLVVEQDSVAVAVRQDAQIVLVMLLVRYERLDDEPCQFAVRSAHLFTGTC